MYFPINYDLESFLELSITIMGPIYKSVTSKRETFLLSYCIPNPRGNTI